MRHIYVEINGFFFHKIIHNLEIARYPVQRFRTRRRSLMSGLYIYVPGIALH